MWAPKDLKSEEVVSSFSFSFFCSRAEETSERGGRGGERGGSGEGEGGEREGGGGGGEEEEEEEKELTRVEDRERGGVTRALGPPEYGTVKFLRNTRMCRERKGKEVLLCY